jgi:hypothetical protein
MARTECAPSLATPHRPAPGWALHPDMEPDCPGRPLTRSARLRERAGSRPFTRDEATPPVQVGHPMAVCVKRPADTPRRTRPRILEEYDRLYKADNRMPTFLHSGKKDRRLPLLQGHARRATPGCRDQQPVITIRQERGSDSQGARFIRCRASTFLGGSARSGVVGCRASTGKAGQGGAAAGRDRPPEPHAPPAGRRSPAAVCTGTSSASAGSPQ